MKIQIEKSGMFDKTTLAYPIIKQCYQDDAQKIKSQLDIITKVRRKKTICFYFLTKILDLSKINGRFFAWSNQYCYK